MCPVKRCFCPQPTQHPVSENACDGRQGRADLGSRIVEARVHDKHHRKFFNESAPNQMTCSQLKKRFVKWFGGLDAVSQEQAVGMQETVEEGKGGGNNLMDGVGTHRKNCGIGPCYHFRKGQPMRIHPCHVRSGHILHQIPSPSSTSRTSATIANPCLVEHHLLGLLVPAL